MEWTSAGSCAVRSVGIDGQMQPPAVTVNRSRRLDMDTLPGSIVAESVVVTIVFNVIAATSDMACNIPVGDWLCFLAPIHGYVTLIDEALAAEIETIPMAVLHH